MMFAECTARPVAPAIAWGTRALSRRGAKSLVLAEVRDHEMHYRLTHVARAFATEKLIEHGEQDPHE